VLQNIRRGAEPSGIELALNRRWFGCRSLSLQHPIAERQRAKLAGSVLRRHRVPSRIALHPERCPVIGNPELIVSRFICPFASESLPRAPQWHVAFLARVSLPLLCRPLNLPAAPIQKPQDFAYPELDPRPRPSRYRR
jgi:hypothetical protein